MRKFLKILPVALFFLYILSSCGWLWEPHENNPLGEELILDYKVEDIFIYTTSDKLMIDTFEVTSFKRGYEEEEDYELIIAAFRSYQILGNKSYVIQVNPFFIAFQYNYFNTFAFYPEGSIYQPVNNREDMEINGVMYNDVYTYEDTLHGDSDSIITKLMYQGNIGILGYKYENGVEYLLDKIILKD